MRLHNLKFIQNIIHQESSPHKAETETKSCKLSLKSDTSLKAVIKAHKKKNRNKIVLTDFQMAEEKKKLKKFYDNPPQSDEFEIIFEKAKRKNR